MLASLGLNNKDIATRLPCDRKTLRRFGVELERARASRQASLKLQQFAAAQQGDTQALRKLLRQADKGREGSSVSAGTKKKKSRAR